MTDPTPPVAARPVSGTLPVPVTVTESNPPVAARPVTPTSDAAAATTVPTEAVADKPVLVHQHYLEPLQSLLHPYPQNHLVIQSLYLSVTESTEPVLAEPVTAVFAAAKTVTEPTPPVDDSPVSGTLASATTETDPTAPVPATPVTTTGMGSPQVPWDHVPLAQPEIAAMGLNL